MKRKMVPLEIQGLPPKPVRRKSVTEVEDKYAQRLEQTCQEVFGFSTFRPKQKEVIMSILGGKDTFVLMPTGAGKSLCFQLPALLLDGVTIVISPLIALMKNQVDGLNKKGISARLYCSQQSKEERERIRLILNTPSPSIKLLYVTPEQIATSGFMSLLQKLNNHNNLGIFAVDEAHAISDWGHDFRIAYRQLSVLKRNFPDIPICALTATATARVQKDIITMLAMKDPFIATLTFNRPNIYYEVRHKEMIPKRDVCSDIVGFINKHPQESGIIYCNKREECEDVAGYLNEHKISAKAYHAGLQPSQRSEIQQAWSSGQVAVIIATIAFGMGIDKPDCRFVIHHSVPKAVEGFYQESGRAGRDGLPSRSILYYSKEDKDRNSFLLAKSLSEEEKNQKSPNSSQHPTALRNSWEKMVQYCAGSGCRRKLLLSYFEENVSNLVCGSCDACNGGCSYDFPPPPPDEVPKPLPGFRKRKRGDDDEEGESEELEKEEEDFYEPPEEPDRPVGPRMSEYKSEADFWDALIDAEEEEEELKAQPKRPRFTRKPAPPAPGLGTGFCTARQLASVSAANKQTKTKPKPKPSPRSFFSPTLQKKENAGNRVPHT